MGARLERLKREKLRRKIKRRKRLTVLLTILILFIGIKTVNQSFVELLQVENEKLFEYSYFNGIYKIQLMGNIYNIEKSDIDMYYRKYRTIVLKYVDQIKDLIAKFKDDRV
ncbi:hypothetical protein [Caloranaerobacter azorensis]|uniref:Uncharacterized protein n=1 Tax=Caloranaerobacter azorensis TaxID=116090 RepID=A0A6P1YEE4_9FIRM|nr:hypothetical protein [Caloranaerobacter azorensis]QIB26336.1 hypothetical protein G3A45_02815 [Caloranaerobacter azorensis]